MKRPFTSHEGAHEHDQSRLRQMEIGDQRVNGAEFIAGGNEDAGRAGFRTELSVFAIDGFQRSDRGRADRDDPAPLFFREIQT